MKLTVWDIGLLLMVAVELLSLIRITLIFMLMFLMNAMKTWGKMPIYSLIAPTNSEFVELRNMQE